MQGQAQISILVVEDNRALRDLVHRLLERTGYRPVCAASAAEARQLWSEHKQEVGLILCDFDLGESADGHSLALSMRADRPEVPVICMSGDFPHDCPMNGQLCKPFSSEALLAAVEKTLTTVS